MSLISNIDEALLMIDTFPNLVNYGEVCTTN